MLLDTGISRVPILSGFLFKDLIMNNCAVNSFGTVAYLFFGSLAQPHFILSALYLTFIIKPSSINSMLISIWMYFFWGYHYFILTVSTFGGYYCYNIIIDFEQVTTSAIYIS
jgi:hypothetical protein